MPLTLTSDAFRKASNFMKLLARPLERAMFQHEAEDGPEQATVDALAEFQNDDGGFGHGIDPDIWMPDSSPLSTTVALRHISALGLSHDHPLITGAVAYLIDNYDTKRAGWSKVSWEVEDAPHAPWWNYSPKLDGPFDPAGWGNPSAEIIGYLHEYRSLVPQEFLDNTTALALNNLAEQPTEIEMPVLLCYLRMQARLPDGIAAGLSDQLTTAGQAVVATDPSEWKSYHAPPTTLAPNLDSLLSGSLRATTDKYLDYLIESQSSDGSWAPLWNWGEQYTHAWEVAKRQWAGYLTLINLRVLKAHNRIESA
jgi:hypothetical protein